MGLKEIELGNVTMKSKHAPAKDHPNGDYSYPPRDSSSLTVGAARFRFGSKWLDRFKRLFVNNANFSTIRILFATIFASFHELSFAHRQGEPVRWPGSGPNLEPGAARRPWLNRNVGHICCLHLLVAVMLEQ
jgi:hypothetical protein